MEVARIERVEIKSFGAYTFFEERGYASGPALTLYKDGELERRARMPRQGFMRDPVLKKFFRVQSVSA